MKKVSLIVVGLLLMSSVVAFAGQSHMPVSISAGEIGSTTDDSSVESNKKWLVITRDYNGVDSFMYMDGHYSGKLWCLVVEGGIAPYAGWVYPVDGSQPWGVAEDR